MLYLQRLITSRMVSQRLRRAVLEINLNSEKLGKGYKHAMPNSAIIKAIADGLAEFSTDKDTLGNMNT